MAQLLPMFLKEIEQEAAVTRKMLALIPEDKYNWQPHRKSMTLQRLAAHIAELPGWVTMTLNTTGLDFAENKYEPKVIESNAALLEYFETGLAEAKLALEKATEEDLDVTWTLRNGEQVYTVSPRHEFIRLTYCQTVHHRAQLGVFLRLLDIPIPGSYGPSADDLGM